MQARFAFCGREDVLAWSAALEPLLTGMAWLPPRPPVGQLIKSLISGRTADQVSQAAFERLQHRFGSARRLAGANPEAVRCAIAEVTYPDDKARHLVSALARIGRERPDFRLEFLGQQPLDRALTWLERLDGVARKVAAATLNASTLSLPVFIVDGHVERVLKRLAFVADRAEARQASDAMTELMAGCWTGADFLRFHSACKRLGQIVCRPAAPACHACPLAADCPSARRD